MGRSLHFQPFSQSRLQDCHLSVSRPIRVKAKILIAMCSERIVGESMTNLLGTLLNI